jgi:hypothetical protein
MAEITKGTASLASQTPPQHTRLSGLVAGEDLADCDACYIKNDGKVWRSTGAAANAAAKVRGFTFIRAKAGEAVTLVWDVNFRYGSGLTPGADLFLSGTVAGGLADAASTGGTAPIGYVIDAGRIAVRRSSY